MKRPVGYLSLVLAALSLVAAQWVRDAGGEWPTLGGTSTQLLAGKALLAAAIGLACYGSYLLVYRALSRWSDDRRRVHDVRSVLRLTMVAVAAIGVFGVLTEQWLGVLFSLGVVGFAVTFALQQPLFSLLGWVYIMVMRPYQVGDRVRVEDARGDVVEVDPLVTTLWEVEGDLVTSHQPSGRVVTLPNSLVLSSEVYNYTRDDFPFVWNELSVQVAYETDIAFAREEMRAVAEAQLGPQMKRNVAVYREQLADTPVELEVSERPTVNVRQGESWVELRLRYLVHPRRMQTVRNELYEAVLARFNEEPERVKFPVGRFR